MMIIGLAGGSGSGKGEVCKIFADLGINSIDTDKIAREVTHKGSKCLSELAQHFSSPIFDILDENGELNRQRLADIAFASPENHEILNQITHKHILKECLSQIAAFEANGKSAVIVDAPLLFESGFDKQCDVIISVISSDVNTRIERIVERDNLSAEQAKKRIEKQKSDEFLIENSTYVIRNDGTISDIESQIKKIYSDMTYEKTVKWENRI